MLIIRSIYALGRGGGGAVEDRRDETAATVSPSERNVLNASLRLFFDNLLLKRLKRVVQTRLDFYIS